MKLSEIFTNIGTPSLLNENIFHKTPNKTPKITIAKPKILKLTEIFTGSKESEHLLRISLHHLPSHLTTLHLLSLTPHSTSVSFASVFT
jgi:hypothetical protein